MHREQVGAAFVALTATPVVGAAGVELNAAVPDSAGFDLNSQNSSIRWDDRTQVKSKPFAKREKHVNAGSS